jgi:hypothetical protein
MVWIKVALVGGVLLLLAGFGLGTQPRSPRVGDQNFSCDAAISSSWLVPGTPDQTLRPGSAASADDRRTAAACSSVIHRSRVAIFSAMGLGGLLVVLGWAAVVERREPESGQVVHSAT